MKTALAALAAHGLRPVLEAALERYKRTGELGRSRPALTPADWEALSRLTGGKAGPPLDLAVLDEALRRSSHGVSLPELLTELNGGPIRVQRQEREAFATAWIAVLEQVSDTGWREVLRGGEGGANLLQKAIKGGSEVALTVQTVAAALALARAETLSFPLLAARVTGNAHALDDDQLAGKVFRAAADRLGVPRPERDGVSSVALCANLCGPDWLTGAAGHTLALPLREVQQLTGLYAPTNRVWVLENPSVFEALHAAHPQAPLICTSGQPGAATTELLRRLPLSTTAFLSCDLDVGGLRIASFLRRSIALHWQPWRMDAQAYALACTRGKVALNGALAGFTDFPELLAAMKAGGVGAHQENLLPELLADLAECPG
ncbi:DUF2399 domain-containing protein [Deinococcus sp.]|uniref:DUF2399 domain-containing protein n=1 Tax=Deinococcus sp. TaxID=47478 RepID=UPI0025C481D6|nr:DUF2399 domain-containing protein [Deinococcus sp.]